VRGVEQIPWLYDLGMVASEATGFARWRRWLVAGARGRVLEVGCGTGRNLPLHPAGAEVTAVDPHPENLARARRRRPSARLLLAKAEALPFPDASFDTVLLSLVLCSVEEPAAALREVHRVLAPGGTLRAIEHVRATAPWRARLQDAVQPSWTRVSGGCRPNRDSEAAVAKAGFTVLERHASGLLRRLVARVRPP